MKWILFLLNSIILFSCTGEQNDKPAHIELMEKMDKKERQKIMEDAMKNAIFKEQQQIKGWVKRQGGNFVETGTGVHTLILNSGDTSIHFESGNKVHLFYTLTLLKGDTIANDWKKGEWVQIENDHKESGLHEALKGMHPGTEAIIVIPSYRAHGLVGDDHNIPSLSSIVYKIKINEV